MRKLITTILVLVSLAAFSQGGTFNANGKLVSGNSDSALTVGQQVSLTSDTTKKFGFASINGNLWFYDIGVGFWSRSGLSDTTNRSKGLKTIFKATQDSATLASSISGKIDTGAVYLRSVILNNTGILHNAPTYSYNSATHDFTITQALATQTANRIFAAPNGSNGAPTFRSLVLADIPALASLTATNSTLTFSGSYDGSTARTIGLNLGNANNWTAQQTFNSIGVNGNIGFGFGNNTNKILIIDVGTPSTRSGIGYLTSFRMGVFAGSNLLFSTLQDATTMTEASSSFYINSNTNASYAANTLVINRLGYASVALPSGSTQTILSILDGGVSTQRAGIGYINGGGVSLFSYLGGGGIRMGVGTDGASISFSNSSINIVPTTGNVLIGGVASDLGSTLKLQVNGIGYISSKLLVGTTTDAGFTGADINGTVRVQNAVTMNNLGTVTADTTTFKPLAINASGQIRPFNAWGEGVVNANYTPTLTNNLNTASATVIDASYYRIGNRVYITATAIITPTNNGSTTQIGLSLPITTAITAGGNGSIVGSRTGVEVGFCQTNTPTTFNLTFVSTGNTASTYFINFSYSL